MSDTPSWDELIAEAGNEPSTTTSSPRPRAPAVPAGKSRKQVLAEFNADIASARGDVSKRQRTVAKQAGKDAVSAAPSVIDVASLFAAVPASVAAAVVPDDYVVGRRGDPKSVKTAGDMSALQQILGPEQLSTGDILKSVFSTPERQRAYLAGEDSNAMRGFEALGLVGDIVLDPLNLFGGAGLADDGLGLVAKGTKVTPLLERLTLRASVDGSDSFAAKAAEVVGRFHTELDAAATLADDTERAAATATASETLMSTYSKLNGEAIMAGDHSLQQARYAASRVIRAAPTGAKNRASLAVDRVNQVLGDIASYTGETPAVVSNRPLPVFGGRSASQTVARSYTSGFGGLSAAEKQSLGITGRLSRMNAADVFTTDMSRSAFNPFASAASGTFTLKGERAYTTPFEAIRKLGLHDYQIGNVKIQKALDTVGDLLNPGVGRSGKMWKAALMATSDEQPVREAALARLGKLVNKERIDDFTIEDWALYPLTAINAARVSSIVSNGGRAISSSAARASTEVSNLIARDAETDPWIAVGVADGTVSAMWTPLKQSSLDAIDSDATAEFRVTLAKAISDSMQRDTIDISDDFSEFIGTRSSEVTSEVARRVLNDPEFGADVTALIGRFSKKIEQVGAMPGNTPFTNGDVLRAAVNAISNAVTISRETNGVFSWRRALNGSASAKEIFTTAGASRIGSEAKLLAHMEELGLAVADFDPSTMSSAQLRARINQLADDVTGGMRTAKSTFDEMITARDDFVSGLRKFGVAEADVAKASLRIDAEIQRGTELRATLESLIEGAVSAETRADATAEDLHAARQLVSKLERSAVRLEQAHLGMLEFRELDDLVAPMAEELDGLLAMVDNASVSTRKVRERIAQILDPELPAPDRAARTAGQGGGRAGDTRLIPLAGANAPGVRSVRQSLNRGLGFARDVLGDSIHLDQIGDGHAALTAQLSRGFDRTLGAANEVTIAEFLQTGAHPKLTELADSMGGWFNVLHRADEDEWTEIRKLGSNLNSHNKALTKLGVDRRAFAEFTLGLQTEFLAKLNPILDDIVSFMDSGEGGERIAAYFAGVNGPDALTRFMTGDLTWLDTMITEVTKSIDTAIGLSGGFGSEEKFNMLRAVVANNPEMTATFRQFDQILAGIEESGTLAANVSSASDAYLAAAETVREILEARPSLSSLTKQRGKAIDDLLGPETPLGRREMSMPDAAVLRDITEQEANDARAVLSGARARVAAAKRELSTVERGLPRIDTARKAALKRVIEHEAALEHFDEVLQMRSGAALAATYRMHQEIQALNQPSMLASILEGSSAYNTVRNGFAAFAADPNIRFYTGTAGRTERSMEQIERLWSSRLERAADWIDTARTRAVDGYVTKGGKQIDPVNRYDDVDRQFEAWMKERALEGFSDLWRGAALADEGSARMMVSLIHGPATPEPKLWSDAYDMIAQMLKSGYVGTMSFSTRNFTGAVIENVRQGVDLNLSRRVWDADRVMHGLEQMDSHFAVMPAEERAAGRAMIERLERAARQDFGDDLFDAVAEARTAGVAESIKFAETAGSEVTVKGTGYRKAIKEAWAKGGLDVRARHGATPGLELLGRVTSAVGEIPAYPARGWEHYMAKQVERSSNGNTWKRLAGDPEEYGIVQAALKASSDYELAPGVESLVRTDLFVQRRLAGDTVDQAFDRVMASHFDYSDLSDFDKVARRAMPFWIWRSRSIAHYSEMMMSRPAMVKATFGVWSRERRSADQRAPRYTQAAGSGYLQTGDGQGMALAVPDPGGDLIDFVESLRSGGPMGPVGETAANDLFAPMLLIPELSSGYTSEGVPLDTPASIQGPLQSLADSGGFGEDVVKQFANKRNGKWYWNSPNAAHAFSEMVPMMNNVSKITTPWTDGENIGESAIGTILRFSGFPVRTVTKAESDRAQASRIIEQRMAARAARRDK